MSRVMTGKSNYSRDKEAHAEIVGLKQEVAELRVAIKRLEGIVAKTINNLGGHYSGSVLRAK